jgi:hypothetical protein
MAQPSAPYTAAALQRATDTNFASGDESGLSTKLEPSAGVKAQGHVSGLAAPAAWANYWEHGVGLWLSYVAALDTDAYFLGRAYAWTAAHTHSANLTLTSGSVDVQAGFVQAEEFRIDHASQEFRYLAARSRSFWIPACEFVPGTGAAVTSGTSVQFSAASAICSLSLHKYLPQGAVVTDLLCRLNQNSGSGVAMKFDLVRTVVDTSPAFADTPNTEATNSLSTGVSGDQLLAATAPFTSTSVDKSADFWTLVITASDAASGGDPELFYGVRIQFNDPGPRNY